MKSINTAALPGKNLLHKLLNYISEEGSIREDFHIIVPEVKAPEHQRGENCKLVALANAIEHAAFKAKVPYLPLYKNKKHPLSLRQVAKTVGGSKVGELYSLESIMKTCHRAGFHSEQYTAYNEDDYIEQLKTYVDQNLSPIVFFDMDLTPGDQYGFPHMGEGKNEHAVLVVGYYTDKEQALHFIVCSWGELFDFNGAGLALSACHSLVDKREPETFRKWKLVASGVSEWRLLDYVLPGATLTPGAPHRTADAIRCGERSLKGKMMVVTGPIPPSPRHLFFAEGAKKGSKSCKESSGASPIYP